MYLDFYKFKKGPFHITPDPEFLFLSESHKEASASLIYGIEERKGFIAITGEIGVGKTTILRAYLEGADPEKLKVVYIFNAALSFESLLKQIFNELGLAAEQGAGVPELVNQLHRFLIEEYKNDRNVALIIDEAQNMPIETLENLRMLSNLETSKDKLVQIVMVGQPEFERKLELTELRQLKQRIAIRCLIKPLNLEESLAYIQHRLMRGSSFHNQVFTKGALKRILDEAKGFPRLINILCDNALITGFGYQCNPVTEKIAKEVISDFRGRKLRRISRRVWPVAAVVCIGIISVGLFFTKPLENRMGSEATQKKIKSVPLPATAVNLSVPQGEPVSDKTSDVRQQTSKFEPPPPKEIESIPGNDPLPPPAKQPLIEKPVGKIADVPKEEPAEKIADVPKQEPAEKIVDVSKQAPIPTMAPPDQPEEKERVIAAARTVIRGDSVSQILVDIYGYCDPELIQLFRDANPQIKDLNRIAVGAQLQLPRLSSPKPRPR
jgi:general secretion pathway protein A